MLVLLCQGVSLPFEISAVPLHVFYHQVFSGQLIVVREVVDDLKVGHPVTRVDREPYEKGGIQSFNCHPMNVYCNGDLQVSTGLRRRPVELPIVLWIDRDPSSLFEVAYDYGLVHVHAVRNSRGGGGAHIERVD